MPRFMYKARSRSGQKVEGVMLAENDNQLAMTLREMDLYLVDAKTEKAPAPSLFGRAVPRRELINFTVHLSASIGAGIPMMQAFEDLERQTTHRKMKKAVQVITEDLRGGSSLSNALSRHPLIFSEIYCNMVRAGETSGSLVRVLHHLIGFLEWQEALAAEIKRASIYPAIVLCAIFGFLAVLLGFVFPRLIPVIQSLKVPLPTITLVIMAASDFLRQRWYVILLLLGGAVTGVRFLKTSEGGQWILDAAKLRLPIIGALVEKICLSRFAHHLGILLRTGIDISQSLTITEKVIGNRVLAQAVGEARERVLQGGSLWRSLEETGVFPPLVIRMIFVGETTGTIDNTLERVTEFYDREVPNSVKKVFTIMEPLVIALLASVVLLIALSIFIPFYSALGKIGRR